MSSNKTSIDMCNGPLIMKLLYFSLPIIASGILQLLYNAADIIVVGRLAGGDSLAAVGTCSTPANLFLNICIGISSGVGIVVAQGYGAKDEQKVQKTVHTAFLLAIIVGTAISVIGLISAKGLLKLISVPDEIFSKAYIYLFIYLLGLPCNMMYNCLASVVRAVGDTKKPLYILTFTGAINVALNIVLVKFLNLDVAGVAISTVVAQILSAILMIIVLHRYDDCICLSYKKLKMHKICVKQILAIGIPAGVQSSLFTVSNLCVLSGINSFGTAVMAGNAAASNIEGFVYTSMNSLHHAATTFAGQNYGAKKINRLWRVYLGCLIIVLVIGLLLGGLVYAFSGSLLSIYNTDPEVIKAGSIKLAYVCLPYAICGLMEVSSGLLKGVGRALGPTVITLIGVCVFRIIWLATVFKQFKNIESLYICYPISWTITFATLVIYIVFTIKKIKRRIVK